MRRHERRMLSRLSHELGAFGHAAVIAHPRFQLLEQDRLLAEVAFSGALGAAALDTRLKLEPDIGPNIGLKWDDNEFEHVHGHI